MAKVDGKKAVENVLAHHGVKGQKWGVRRSRAAIDSAPSSEEHTKTADTFSKAKETHSTRTLSNKELQDAITRMNLEQQYSRLTGSRYQSLGKRFINGFRKDSSDVLRQTAKETAKQQAVKKIALALAKAGAAAA